MEKVRETDPELFQTMRDNPIHEIFEGLDPRDLEVRPEEIKVYPGSKRGMSPQDDPQVFAEWLEQNMPKAYQLLLERTENLAQNYTDKLLRESHLLENKESKFLEEPKSQKQIEEEKAREGIEESDSEQQYYDSKGSSSSQYPNQYWEFLAEGMLDEYVSNNQLDMSRNLAMEKSTYANLPILPPGAPLDYDSRLIFEHNWSLVRDPLK
jgi:hypothetical protein